MSVTITTRQSQLTELTHAQVDQNFTNLKQAVDANTAAFANYAPLYAPSFSGGVRSTSSGIVTVLSADASGGYLEAQGANNLRFYTSGTERMRFDIDGNLLVGATTGNYHLLLKNSAEGQTVLGVGNASTYSALFYSTSAVGVNAAATCVGIFKNSSTSRSINAAGTINASGADYAEYMTKAAGCGTLAKGQIVGVDAAGLITDKWCDAVSFLIKSTNPSYVGGDAWGTDEALGMTRPADDASDDARAEFEAALEAARQRVDRIAYCGQVPVNVIGATPGQYVVPAQDGEGIGALLVDDATVTFEQYRRAVGIVQNILPDGRANVRVKAV